MTVLDKAKLLLPTADEALLAFAVDTVTDAILNYCNLEKLPQSLDSIAACMVLDLWRQSAFGTEQQQGQIKGVSRGDTSYSFTTAAEQWQAAAANPSFMQDYKTQLNCYRKMR